MRCITVTFNFHNVDLVIWVPLHCLLQLRNCADPQWPCMVPPHRKRTGRETCWNCSKFTKWGLTAISFRTCRIACSNVSEDSLADELDKSYPSSCSSDSASTVSDHNQHVLDELVCANSYLPWYEPCVCDRLLRPISMLCDSDTGSDEDYDPQLSNSLSWNWIRPPTPLCTTIRNCYTCSGDDCDGGADVDDYLDLTDIHNLSCEEIDCSWWALEESYPDFHRGDQDRLAPGFTGRASVITLQSVRTLHYALCSLSSCIQQVAVVSIWYFRWTQTSCYCSSQFYQKGRLYHPRSLFSCSSWLHWESGLQYWLPKRTDRKCMPWNKMHLLTDCVIKDSRLYSGIYVGMQSSTQREVVKKSGQWHIL